MWNGGTYELGACLYVLALFFSRVFCAVWIHFIIQHWNVVNVDLVKELYIDPPHPLPPHLFFPTADAMPWGAFKIVAAR